MATRIGGRGRRASGEAWARRIGEWRRSGVSAERFCRGRDFAVSTLRWWAWRLGSTVDEAKSAGVNRDDAPIVAAALDSDAQYFVSGDRRLVTEIKRVDPPFRVLSPRQFLEEIGK